MKRQSWLVAIVVIALLGASAAFLNYTRSHQRLGQPGVKVGLVPLYGVEKDSSGTNRQFLVSSNSVLLPEKVLDYTSKPLLLSRVVYDWLPKDTVYGQRNYTAPDGFGVQTSVVLMGGDRTSIHQPQYCLAGQGFQNLKEHRDTIRLARPHPYDLPVMKIVSQRTYKNREGRTGTVSAVYVYWFVADNELTADHWQRMWWMGRDLVCTAVLQRWAYISYLAFCSPGQETAIYERMKQFIAASAPEFQIAPRPPLKAAATP